LLLTLRAASVANIVAALPPSERRALAGALEEASRPFNFDGTLRSYATSHIVTAWAEGGGRP
jgi:hypothetical protein